MNKAEAWKILKSESGDVAAWLEAMRSQFGTPSGVMIEVNGKELINTLKPTPSEHERNGCDQQRRSRARY